MVGGLLAEDEDRRVDPGLPQCDTLSGERDAQPGAPGIQGGAADGDRAVAVAVGLDHRPNGGGRGGRTEDADVVGDGVEVDLGPRPARRLSRHPKSAKHVGQAVDEVAGDEPDGRAAQPRLGVDPRPCGSGAERVHAGGEQRADDA